MKIYYKSYDYNANLTLAKPYLPANHRFLKLGETIPKGAKAVGWECEIMPSAYVGATVNKHHCPIFVPVERVRGAKGRFAKKVVYPHVKSVKHYNDLSASIEYCDKILSGDSYGILRSFCWQSVAPSGDQDYWSKRFDKEIELSPADLDFVRAVKKEFEARLEAVMPAPKPAPQLALGEKIVKALEAQIAAAESAAESHAKSRYYGPAASYEAEALTLKKALKTVKSFL